MKYRVPTIWVAGNRPGKVEKPHPAWCFRYIYRQHHVMIYASGRVLLHMNFMKLCGSNMENDAYMSTNLYSTQPTIQQVIAEYCETLNQTFKQRTGVVSNVCESTPFKNWLVVTAVGCHIWDEMLIHVGMVVITNIVGFTNITNGLDSYNVVSNSHLSESQRVVMNLILYKMHSNFVCSEYLYWSYRVCLQRYAQWVV